MAGLGERLGPALATPPLFAVLANPAIPVATPDVFAKLGLERGASTGWGPSPRIGAGLDQAGVHRRAAKRPQRFAGERN